MLISFKKNFYKRDSVFFTMLSNEYITEYLMWKNNKNYYLVKILEVIKSILCDDEAWKYYGCPSYEFKDEIAFLNAYIEKRSTTKERWQRRKLLREIGCVDNLNSKRRM